MDSFKSQSFVPRGLRQFSETSAVAVGFSDVGQQNRLQKSSIISVYPFTCHKGDFLVQEIEPQIRLHAVIISGIYLSSSFSTKWKNARTSLKKRKVCAFFHSKLTKLTCKYGWAKIQINYFIKGNIPVFSVPNMSIE